MSLGLLEDQDDDDPMLSLVNLIDVFLVVIAALLLATAANPLQQQQKMTSISSPGGPDMEIIVRDGLHVERFRAASGDHPEGRGVKAGTAWRMPDGSVVYVPE